MTRLSAGVIIPIHKPGPTPVPKGTDLVGRLPLHECFNPKNIRSLQVSRALLGEGDYGYVQRGTMTSTHETSLPVAVKRFKAWVGMDHRKAAVYQTAITRLLKEGVDIPVGCMLRWDNPATGITEWVQVSEVFESGGQSNFYGDVKFLDAMVPPHLPAFVSNFAGIINAGYAPTIDCFHWLETGHGRIAKPLDLDWVIESGSGLTTYETQARSLGFTLHTAQSDAEKAGQMDRFVTFIQSLMPLIRSSSIQAMVAAFI
ncbi:Uncharacterised protein [Candidatus Bilamarchaeum dharawalense]|uniref:Uncharacterized protein n=1 Tax=Candidatus Bilamarchaeum dharawalense TaxID=2885759 RepID=A0A5E4LSF6_9ARCH|nr:Uncharacterised protein [Candidatus Bilamarchaeum dharawalense]